MATGGLPAAAVGTTCVNVEDDVKATLLELRSKVLVDGRVETIGVPVVADLAVNQSINQLLQVMLAYRIEWDEADMALIEYNGFSVESMMAILVDKKQAKTSLQMQEFIKDMAFICGLYIYRGTNISKIKNKVKVAGRQKIERLVTLYGILDRVPQNDDGKTVTVGRIVACFPYVICTILDSSPKTFSAPISCPLPKFMLFPGFASLIPKEGHRTILIAHFGFLILLDRKINSKRELDIKSIRDYQRISHGNIVYDEDFRDTVMDRLFLKHPEVRDPIREFSKDYVLQFNTCEQLFASAK